MQSMSSYCTVTILNYFFDVFVTLCWYCVGSLAFAVTIAVSMWRGWLVELFGLEFPRVFDDATALTLLAEPIHAKHEFILLSFLCLCGIVLILCLFTCLCCYDCGIHVARMISGVVRTRVSESLRWRDSSYTLDRACSYQAWVHTVLYLFYVFVALRWYCVCSLAFAVTIAVSMWRGWSMELFGPEFPRVFDDAIPLLHSWQGLCWLIFLWLVSFIWPGWRLWNPWNNCIAWPWTRPSAAPVVLRLRPHFGCQETDLVSQSVIIRLMKKIQNQLPTQLVW